MGARPLGPLLARGARPLGPLLVRKYRPLGPLLAGGAGPLGPPLAGGPLPLGAGGDTVTYTHQPLHGRTTIFPERKDRTEYPARMSIDRRFYT